MYDDQEIRLLSEILPNVAAQLRPSLGNLQAAVRHMTPRDEGDLRTEQSLAMMNQSYYRMLRLVNNLSAAPMLLDDELFCLQDVELVAWLDELCRKAQPLAEEAGIELLFSGELKAHTAAIHPMHLERLVWNLLSNALKFTPKGGHITVSLKRSGGQLLLGVTDDGCGISEELQETVFDRYLHPQRMDPQPHGLGLGLPLCRRIAQGHGGRLVLSSRPGEGTAVTVALPDRRVGGAGVSDQPFQYTGGFQPVLVELADALPYKAYYRRYID